MNSKELGCLNLTELLTRFKTKTFKQLIIYDGNYMLKAINSNWTNQYSPINGNCQIVGKVITGLETF